MAPLDQLNEKGTLFSWIIYTKAKEADLVRKARVLATLTTGMAGFMLIFLILLGISGPTLEGGLIIGGLFLASAAGFWLNRNGQVVSAAWVFLAGYTLLIVISMLMNPDPQSAAPYYLLVPVVVSGGLISSRSPFGFATAALFGTVLMVSMAELPPATGNLPPQIGAVLVPGVLLYLIATISWLLGGESELVNEYSHFVKTIEGGDLRSPLAVGSEEGLGQLGKDLESMRASLNDMISNLQEGIANLSSSTTEIMAAVSQHTASANEQSAAIQQTSTTADEVRTATEQTTKKAQDVVHQAQDSVKVSKEGTQAVERIIQEMRDLREKVGAIAQDILMLSEQTQQIGEITATVNDIADQSNLLALNATIEAARAGEHGKGFAVVAAEVRNLAEQSKRATEQVQDILSDIQNATHAAVLATEQGTQGVEEGMQLAQRAGVVIQDLEKTVEVAMQSCTPDRRIRQRTKCRYGPDLSSHAGDQPGNQPVCSRRAPDRRSSR